MAFTTMSSLALESTNILSSTWLSPIFPHSKTMNHKLTLDPAPYSWSKFQALDHGSSLNPTVDLNPRPICI